MNRIFFLFALISIISIKSFSQDIIRYVDGTEEKAKIVETNDNYIIIKNIETEIKDTILSGDIKEIQFRNGKIVKYTDPNKKIKEYELRNFSISLEVLELTRGFVSTDLEFYLGNKSSIMVPLGKGLGNNDFYLGIDYRHFLNRYEQSNIYLGSWKLGTGQFRYFIAPGAIFMKERLDSNNIEIISKRMAASLTIGTSLNLTWGFCLSAYVGVAPGILLESSKFEAIPLFRISMGYRLNKRKN